MTVRAPRTLDPGAPPAPRARALRATPGALSPLDALAILHRGRVEVDPSAPFEVSWWDRARGSRAVRLDTSRPPGDPHTSHTLATLAAHLEHARSRPSAKGESPSLCGAAFRPSAEGSPAVYRPRGEDVRGVALLQLDVDGREGDTDAATLADGGEMLCSLDVGAVLHPSPSSPLAGGAAPRWRAWVRLARAGAGELLLSPGASSRARADLADAVRCCGAILGAALGAGARVDRATHRASALGYVDAAPSTLGGVSRVEACGALDPFEVRAAARAAGAWPVEVRAAGARDPAALLALLRAVEEVLPGTLGPGRAGVYPVRCPGCDTHTGDAGRGAPGDTSCALNLTAGLLWCSHTSHGPMGEGRMLARWCELAPDHAAAFRALAGRARNPSAVEVLRAVHAGAPGDTAGGRVEWQTGPAGVVHHVAGPDDTGAEVCELLRGALLAHARGDRRVRLLLAPTGARKSATLGAALSALAPSLPGELDNRPDTARPVGAILVETREAMHSAAARVDAAGAAEVLPGDLVQTRRGREGLALRAGVYIPLSRVGADCRDLGAEADAAPDAAHGCPHWRTAGELERAGIGARGALCGFAGTDDPEALRGGLVPRGPCPRRDAGCNAAAPFHYLDGRVPSTGEPWVAVATGASSPAIPEPVEGAPLFVDETDRIVSRAAVRLDASTVAPGSPAATLAELLATDTARDVERGHRPRASAKAVFRGLLAMVAEHGAEVLLRAPVEAREALALGYLARWGRGDATARSAWRTLAPFGAPGDTPEGAEDDPGDGAGPLLPVARVRAALERWRTSRPVVGGLRRRGARALDAGPWWALQAWAHGAETLRAVEVSRVEGEPFEVRELPGAVEVFVPSPAAALAERWNHRGPVVALDATGDVGALAGALRAGEPSSSVRGIVARALSIPDAAEVRRVVVRTGDAGRGALTLGHGAGARVAWGASRHTPGAAKLLAGALREVLRAAPRLDGSRSGPGPLAPVVWFAPPPLARALAALAEGITPEQLAAGENLPDGPPLTLAQREAVIASVARAPAEVRELARELHKRCARVWWSYPGATFARGSNLPHEGGARCVVTVGDGLLPPAEAARRARAAGRNASAEGAAQQAAGDAARELAQQHGRVRVRELALTGAPVLLLHLGALRPMDWPGDAARVEVLSLADLAGLSTPSAGADTPAPRVALPAPVEALPVEALAPPPSATLPAPLAAARAAGWTVAGVARACGVATRTVRRWQSGESTPAPEQLEPLAAALASAEEQTRAAYRAMLRPGRRVGDLVRGRGRAWSRVAGLLALSAERAAAGDAGVRELRGADLDGFEAWLEGRGALSPATLATLATLAPSMALRWGPGPARVEAPAPAPFELSAEAVEALGRVGGALDGEGLDAMATALAQAPGRGRSRGSPLPAHTSRASRAPTGTDGGS